MAKMKMKMDKEDLMEMKKGTYSAKAERAENAKKKVSKAKLGSGGRFKAVSGSVAKEYMKKGMSAKKAQSIGAAVAAKAGRAKYGTSRMASLSTKGK